MIKSIPRMIVCAAIRNEHDHIICGARHYDVIMHGQIPTSNDDWIDSKIEQGFIDQKGVFLNRKEAWIVAEEAGQIIRDIIGCRGKLFSENLY